MNTIQKIWSLCKKIEEFLSGLSDNDVYLLTFKLSKNNLQSNEVKIIEDPLFKDLLDKYQHISHNKRLQYVLQIYNRQKSIQKIQKNPKWEYNDFDEYNIPLDGITFEPIPENKIFILNKRCYNIETIKQILITKGEDPFSREKIPKYIYKQVFSPLDNSVRLKFLEEFSQLTKTMLNDPNFKNNNKKYKDWMLDPPMFHNNKTSNNICYNVVDQIITTVISYHRATIFVKYLIIIIGIFITIQIIRGIFNANILVPMTLAALIGTSVLPMLIGIDQYNAILKANKLFKNYINYVNNIYFNDEK